jgi:small redox-active disulfide protein 2
MERTAKERIEVLGPGCARCRQTYRLVRGVVESEGLPFEVVEVESMERMVALGLLATPAIAVGGKVVLAGRVPKAEEIRTLLTHA